jgi:hypothetical protein
MARVVDGQDGGVAEAAGDVDRQEEGGGGGVAGREGVYADVFVDSDEGGTKLNANLINKKLLDSFLTRHS